MSLSRLRQQRQIMFYISFSKTIYPSAPNQEIKFQNPISLARQKLRPHLLQNKSILKSKLSVGSLMKLFCLN